MYEDNGEGTAKERLDYDSQGRPPSQFYGPGIDLLNPGQLFVNRQDDRCEWEQEGCTGG